MSPDDKYNTLKNTEVLSDESKVCLRGMFSSQDQTTLSNHEDNHPFTLPWTRGQDHFHTP